MEGNALNRGQQAVEEFKKANEFRKLPERQRTFDVFQKLYLKLEEPIVHAFNAVCDEQRTFDNLLKLDINRAVNLRHAFSLLPDSQKKFNNLISTGMINKLVKVYFIDQYCSKDSLLNIFRCLLSKECGEGANRRTNYAIFKHFLDQGIALVQYSMSQFNNTLNSYNLSSHLYKSI